jgi:hypothetical protein
MKSVEAIPAAFAISKQVSPLTTKWNVLQVVIMPGSKGVGVAIPLPEEVVVVGKFGGNVKVSLSVVMVAVVAKPVGTGIVKESQNKVPAEEVTNAPLGRVSNNTPLSMGLGPAVGRNVNVSPSVVTTAVVLKALGTGTVKVPQNKVPEEEVTTKPPSKVSVNAPNVAIV